MNVILFDDKSWYDLLPLTYTRPVSEIRVGITTIREKWKMRLGVECSYCTREYLSVRYSMSVDVMNLMINASVLPDKNLVDSIHKLGEQEVLKSDNIIIAAWVPSWAVTDFIAGTYVLPKEITYTGKLNRIAYPWDIFRLNAEALELDFHLLIASKKSIPLSNTNTSTGRNIFIEEGAKVEFSHLNSSEGPVYIGKNAEIMEGSLIRGPFALLEGSIVKMGARIYGATTIGPGCKVGGEVKNAVIFGHSNKAHDGYLGDAVIGEWVNIGADTNASNLKNNYDLIKVWNESAKDFIPTGLQFCGLIIGDHSKCGINTMFNTASVVGVCCNIFGSGFPEKFIPSFSWGGSDGFTEYKPEKALETAQRMMDRAKRPLSEEEKNILLEVFALTAHFRNG